MSNFKVRGATFDQVQPFAFDRGPIGCVLLHGFTAAPKEMFPLGEYLANRNYTIRGVRLAGHATSPEDLAQTTWRDWIISAKEAVEELRARCQQVWIIGLSLGGLIGLHLAEHHLIDGVIALAPPILTPDWRMSIARFIWRFKPYSVKGLANLHDEEALLQHADYEHNPTRAVAEMYDLIRRTRFELKMIYCPLLLIFARHDSVVSIKNADYIWPRVRSVHKEKFILERGGHIMTEDVDKAVAFQKIGEFLTEHTHKG
jgi:carboxylesterase